MGLIRLLKRDLTKEVSTWVATGLISIDQARSICKVYDIDYDSMQNHSTAYRLLVSLGYLFIGLAAITLIGANWDEIPRALRMVGLLVITIGTHGLGMRFYLKKQVSTAVGLFMLGNFFYGASIILIAQIYHLGEHMPDGIFWWALGSLPFGVLLKNTKLTLFSCLLALLWFFIEFSAAFSPTLFPLFIVAGLYVLVQGSKSTSLFLLIVASIVFWIEYTLSEIWTDNLNNSIFHLQAEHFFITVALFIFAYSFSHWLHSHKSGKAKDYGAVLSLWVLRFAFITMIMLSYSGTWEELIKADWDNQVSMWQIVIALIWLSLWLGWKTGKLKKLALVATFCMLSMVSTVLTDDFNNAIYFQIIYNIMLVSCGIWLIIRGVQGGISHYFFLGITSILLVAFLRYIDLIGDYIGGATLFIMLASVLLVSAKYWKEQQNITPKP